MNFFQVAVAPCNILLMLSDSDWAEWRLDEVELTVDFECVDVLFLEEYADPSGFEDSYMIQTIYGVSGKSGDGFGMSRYSSWMMPDTSPIKL